MVDEVITKQELIDAQKDAKSLEEVVNGSETKQVTTRLGETYPSVKKAVKTMFENGGLPATPFTTKALMTASPLVDGDYAYVTLDGSNNGLYILNGSEWDKIKIYEGEVQVSLVYNQDSMSISSAGLTFDKLPIFHSSANTRFTIFDGEPPYTVPLKGYTLYAVRKEDVLSATARTGWFTPPKIDLIEVNTNEIKEKLDGLIPLFYVYLRNSITSDFAVGSAYHYNALNSKTANNEQQIVSVDGALTDVKLDLESRITDISSSSAVQVYLDLKGDSARLEFPNLIFDALPVFHSSANTRFTIFEGEPPYTITLNGYSIFAVRKEDVLNATERTGWFTPPKIDLIEVKTNSNTEKLDGLIPLFYSPSRGRIANIFALGLDFNFRQLSNAVAEIKTENDRLYGVRSAFPPKANHYDVVPRKASKFYQKWKLREQDVTVCLTGSSLTLGHGHCVDLPNATERPPSLHTDDLASQVYDVLSVGWTGQEFRRFDHGDISASESEWAEIEKLEGVWDDPTRKGVTKTTKSPNASVSIVIPEGAYRFNYVYRTDSESGNCEINIAEGDNLVEVFDGSNWVEANGYVFSKLEPSATTTKGNTVWGKRLKMRCCSRDADGIDSLGLTKTLTVSKGNNNDRFNFWGFEWSPREFMFTVVNSARGGHQWGVKDSVGDLEDYQDGDLWEHDPDLVLCETTVGNWGGVSNGRDPQFFVNCAKRAYFNEFNDAPNSFYEKAGQYQDVDVIFYGGTASVAAAYIGSIWDSTSKEAIASPIKRLADNGDGSVDSSSLGRMNTVWDNYEAVEQYMLSREDVAYIPVINTFKRVAKEYYGSYFDSWQASGKGGSTMCSDTTHPNSNGHALWGHIITAFFENI